MGEVYYVSDSLPTDLDKFKIVYVNIKEKGSTAMNMSFRSKMKKYPYQYKITDDVTDISDCKYRLFVKEEEGRPAGGPSITSPNYTTTVSNTGKISTATSYSTSSPSSGGTWRQQSLYLEEIGTHKCYKILEYPIRYNIAFKYFVQMVRGKYKYRNNVDIITNRYLFINIINSNDSIKKTE